MSEIKNAILGDIGHLRLLDNIDVPEGLDVSVTDSSEHFMDLRTQLNSSMPLLFGSAYRQGNRLHFATAMSVRDYLKLIRLDQAERGSTLEEVKEHTNRPKEKAHGKDIAKYLRETACVGHNFIFPSFLLNYGWSWHEDMPKASLTIYCGTREALAWPAIFSPPALGGLPVTDGGHRTDEMAQILESASFGRLPENALSVIFIFEENRDQYHQDFADCAKAKTISKSLQGSWDQRDVARRFGINLVEGNRYLRRLIDATSNSVNLSTNSTKAWSMSALQATIEGMPRSDGIVDGSGLNEFLDAAFEKIPLLQNVVRGMDSHAHDRDTPAKYRKERGGCVLFRGVGLAVLIQAYLYAVEKKIDLNEMAGYMARVDWFVLKSDARPQREGEDAHSYTTNEAQKIWHNMLVMIAGDTKWRLKGTRVAAEKSFNQICRELDLPTPLSAAAE